MAIPITACSEGDILNPIASLWRLINNILGLCYQMRLGAALFALMLAAIRSHPIAAIITHHINQTGYEDISQCTGRNIDLRARIFTLLNTNYELSSTKFKYFPR
jgi:hypothetical protein